MLNAATSQPGDMLKRSRRAAPACAGWAHLRVRPSRRVRPN